MKHKMKNIMGNCRIIGGKPTIGFMAVNAINELNKINGGHVPPGSIAAHLSEQRRKIKSQAKKA